MEVVIIAGLIGAAIWYAAWHRPRRATKIDAAQAWVESRMLHLLQIDPDAPNELIATLVRDEVINTRQRDPVFFTWATPETAARLKRTAVRLVVEQRAQKLPVVPAPPAPPLQKKCMTCGAKNKPSRERCRKCFSWLEEEKA